MCYFWYMEYESVKINKDTVQMVRELKAKIKIPISSFFEMAALEKIKKEQSKLTAKKLFSFLPSK